jgi:hypothetical protein
MAADFDWAGFRALVKRLGDLAGRERDDADFAQELRRALTFVYTAGVTMPSAGDVYEAAGGAEFWNDVEVPGVVEGAAVPDTSAAAEALAERIAASVESAQPDELADPEEIESVSAAAAENVLDTLSALSAGSTHFDEKRFSEAHWEWAFGFDDWGTTALAALSALHELLWGAR